MVDLDALLPELRCPICFESLKDTYTVMECLHRFCKGCIERVLRGAAQTQHSCPSCRRQLGHRRSLRKDSAYDALIAVLTDAAGDEQPFDAEAFREEHRRKVQLMQERSRGLRDGGEVSSSQPASGSRPRHKRKSAKVAPPSAPEPEADLSSMVNLALRLRSSVQGSEDLHCEVSELELPHLRVPAAATVGTLQRFLRLRHSLEEQQSVFVTLEQDEQMEVLAEDLTLFELCAHRWKARSTLTLSYFVIS